MASKLHAGNGTAIPPKIVTESETRVTHVVETARPVESAPDKEVEPLDNHPTFTELAPAAETTKVHSPMASKVHSGNGIPLTATVETEKTVEAEVKEAPEKRRFLRGIGPEKRRFLLEATLVADHPTVTEVASAAETTDPKKNWPGSSGECVFRVIVPMLKVESIFGRNGNGEQLINKMCQETKANIRVLKDSVCGRNLIVEVSDKEEIEAPLSPAMDAVIRVFKLVNGFPENEGSDGVTSIPHCSILLLMPLMQVMSLIERRGSPIRTILENCCYVGSLSLDKVSTFSANPNDRVVNLYGEGHKVLQALEAVLRHLRKFLVVQTIEIPLVDAVNIIGIGGTNSGCTGGATFTVQESNYAPKKKVSVEIRGTSSQVQAAKQLIQAKTGPGRVCFQRVRQVVDQVAQTMQIPLVDAVGIIGVEGTNFGCTSGAVFTVQETKVSRTRITVELRGTTSQVQTAQQLIQAKTGRVSFGKVKSVVDQALTRPGPDSRGKQHRCSMLPPSHVAAGPLGEVTHKPQATGPLVPPSAEISPPLAAIGAPVEPQTEPMVCSSLVKVPPKLLHVQPASELMTIETEAEVPPELPQVQPASDRLGLNKDLPPPSHLCHPHGSHSHLSPQPTVTAAPSDMKSKKNLEENKVPWNINIVKTFLDACIHEITINGRECGSLKAVSWKKVGEMLKDRHNLSADSKQMNSYFNGLKSKYMAWVSLKNKTGNIYDPSTNTFNLTDKEWETEMKKNKYIETLRKSPLRFPDLCAQLFDNAISTGYFQTAVDQALTGREPAHRPNGEASLEPHTGGLVIPTSSETSPPLATTETPVEPQKEPMVCNSLVEVPPELPQVQPATAFRTVETKAEVPPDLPEVQPPSELMAIETEAKVPAELPHLQPAIETKAEVPTKLPEVQPASEPMAIETEAEVPAKLPQVQSAMETKPEVPTELSEVQPISSLEAIVTKAEEPVVPVSTDDSTVVNGAMQMQVEKSVVRTRPGQAFSGRVQNYFGQRLAFPGPTRTLTEPNLDRVHLHKDLPPPSHHGRRQPMSLPPHVSIIPSGMESNKEPKRIRVCWNINIVKTFLDACIHEVTINGWEDGSLKVMSWKNVMEILKDRHKFSVDRIQMKSYFDGLKSKYNAWVSLKSKTGNKYDPSTNMFNLSDKEWEIEMKNKKIIGTLRNAPLPFPNLCAQLFGGTISTGIKGCGPGSAKPIPLVSPSSSNPPVKNEQKMGEASLELQAAVPLVPSSAATETPVEPQKEPMVCSSLVEVPPELPQVQPTTACMAVESKAEVPTELPEVHPVNALEAIETKPEEPVVPVSTDDSEVVDEPVEMQVEESVVLTGLDHAFFGPDHTAPGFFRTGIDQALSGPSLDRVHPYKDLSPPSHRCNTNCRCGHQSRRRTLSPPPHVAAAPSGMESIEESKRHRYHWNDNTVKTFLDACIQEISVNGWESGSLKAMSWKKVGEMLKASHNFSVDSKQMKNYFDGLNSKYKAWVSLKHKTGNKYDPSTNMFNLTDKEWTTEMMENKYLETPRNAPLPFPDLCTQLFDGATSTGSFQTCDDQALTGPEPGEIIDEPQATVPLVPPSAATEAPVEPQKEPMVEVPPELPHHVQPACMEIETEAEVPPELPHVQPATEVVPIETEQSMSVFEEKILGVLKVIADKMSKPEPPPKPTFEDCEKKLNELGWANDDPLHLVALTIFCDENDNYRELWMKLNQNLCADWLRMIGRSKRFN